MSTACSEPAPCTTCSRSSQHRRFCRSAPECHTAPVTHCNCPSSLPALLQLTGSAQQGGAEARAQGEGAWEQTKGKAAEMGHCAGEDLCRLVALLLAPWCALACVGPSCFAHAMPSSLAPALRVFAAFVVQRNLHQVSPAAAACACSGCLQGRAGSRARRRAHSRSRTPSCPSEQQRKQRGLLACPQCASCAWPPFPPGLCTHR